MLNSRARIVLFSMLTLFCAGNCVDPFADQTTTPQKLQAGRLSKAKRADAGIADASSDAKKPTQTFQQAWHLICHAEQLSKPDPSSTVGQRKDAVAQWLVSHLKNTEVRFWFISFGKAKKAAKPTLFEAEAKRAGISNCPLSKLLFSETTSPADAGVAAVAPPAG